LRCKYCFYLDRCELYPETEQHRMSDEVLDQMLRTFMATKQPQHAIGWQGGEPTLMGLPFFQRVTELQKQYGQRGIPVSNGLQTNTTLLDDAWCTHLGRYKFLVGVSIDGPAPIHDHYRVNAAGRGAHADVMRGLAALKRNHVEYNVLTLVSQSNVRQPREVYRYLRDELGVNFHQYIECVEFDAQGGLMPFAINAREWGSFLCEIFDVWWESGDTRRVSVRLFDSVLTALVDHQLNVCAMGRDCRQYLVVEHNGDVYPCDFFVRPELKLGNIMEHSWEALLASPLYAEFGARKRQWNEACGTCRYLPLCGGCCPKNRPDHGADPRKLSTLCAGWKQFYDHTMPRFEQLAGEIMRERAGYSARPPSASAQSPQSIGRNDPCPCGSGKKFKKCCM
jgi:uncharacterized protein